MVDPFASIPGYPPPSETWVLRHLRVELLVDPDAVTLGPIVRGAGPPWLRGLGPGIRDLRLLRQRLRPVLGPGGWLEAAENARSPFPVAAITGCGNIGMNPGVRAITDQGSTGPLPPPGELGSGVGALWVTPEGRGHRTGADISAVANVGFAVTGPDLVVDGRAVPPDPLAFGDPRHLLLFPYLRPANGDPEDLGHDALLQNLELYKRAVAGHPVSVDRHHIDDSSLEQALRTKGYRIVDHRDAVTDRGTAHVGDVLTLVYQDGVYPHQALCVEADGTVASHVVPGLSNRSGTTIRRLAEHLARQGVREAVLLDNGGDVGLWRPESGFAVRPAESDRADCWPLSACLIWRGQTAR